jgi:hypothetical protein
VKEAVVFPANLSELSLKADSISRGSAITETIHDFRENLRELRERF